MNGLGKTSKKTNQLQKSLYRGDTKYKIVTDAKHHKTEEYIWSTI